MTSVRFWVAATLVAATLLAGCDRPEADEDEGPALPKPVTFEGKVEPALVGSWKTTDGASALDLAKDGKAKILSAASTPGGLVKNTYEGEWLTSGENLLLRYTVPGQTETVVKYGYKLSGKELTLATSARTKTVYQKR